MSECPRLLPIEDELHVLVGPRARDVIRKRVVDIDRSAGEVHCDRPRICGIAGHRRV